MIITIFVMFLFLAFALILTGFYTKDSSVQLIGFAFLFILGGVMANVPVLNNLTGTLEYKTGENITTNYIYSDNYTGYHWDYESAPPVCNNPTDTGCINIFHTETETSYLYTAYEDGVTRFIGVFLMIISIIASSIIFTRLKEDDD